MVAEPKKEVVIIEKKVRRQKITPPGWIYGMCE
jgi:hypothetical protein